MKESITRSINNKLYHVSAELPDKPNITSYSFRVGYITQLWKDTGDREFVRQAVGQIKVQSTSTYVENLPDAERQKRMLQVKSIKDLIISNISN
jgi:hypothetical protein